MFVENSESAEKSVAGLSMQKLRVLIHLPEPSADPVTGFTKRSSAETLRSKRWTLLILSPACFGIAGMAADGDISKRTFRPYTCGKPGSSADEDDGHRAAPGEGMRHAMFSDVLGDFHAARKMAV